MEIEKNSKEEKILEKTILEAKIKSLEIDLIELPKTKSLAWTAFCIGVTQMEKSLVDKLKELSKELRSLNLNNANNSQEGNKKENVDKHETY